MARVPWKTASEWLDSENEGETDGNDGMDTVCIHFLITRKVAWRKEGECSQVWEII